MKRFSLVGMVRKSSVETLLDMHNLSITKSNYLIEARYKLPVQAQKLILACLGKIDPRHEIPKEITMTGSEFSELMGIDIKNSHRELYKAADKLYQSDILIYENGEEIELSWVQEKAKKLKGEAAVRLVWSDRVLRYISQIRGNFTSYKLRNIAELQSSHSIRIYELLMRFADTGDREIFLDDFKSILGISNKYPEFKVLNRDVIKLAVKELNQRSNLVINCTPIKRGRTVEKLRFDFKQNNQLKMDI
ncbi:replication initiation protein [Candidatus Enterovibrio escicola]|uniref:replication initiation protein n=1 Tax=Candidatus Enterovibrio escicola TaxID=1927127 RepID=UPI001CC2641E|nr:replication initiation protein [Candidatus Enterovibrio escacola]